MTCAVIVTYRYPVSCAKKVTSYAWCSSFFIGIIVFDDHRGSGITPMESGRSNQATCVTD